LKFEPEADSPPSSSAKADDPVRCGPSVGTLAPVEYWIARFRGR
jgi:hypothetical protein